MIMKKQLKKGIFLLLLWGVLLSACNPTGRIKKPPKPGKIPCPKPCK